MIKHIIIKNSKVEGTTFIYIFKQNIERFSTCTTEI